MKRASIILFTIGVSALTLYALTAVLRQDNSLSLLAEGDAVSYAIIDAGTLGGDSSEAASINDTIQLVGSSTISGEEDVTAFLWQTNVMTPLTATGSLITHASAINDPGQVVGVAISGTGQSAVHWPVLWAAETVTKLATIDGAPGTARAINNHGLIAGNTLTESDNHLLFWQDNSLTGTIPISNGVGWANGLNDAGHMVGHIVDGPGSSFAFLWRDGAFTNLGTLSGSTARAADINNSGQIVGSAAITDDLSTHAFLWQDGEMQDLGVLGEVFTATSKANAVNNLGVVVGQAQLGEEQHAVLWQGGEIVDLNTLLPTDSKWELLLSAESINDQGWIAGTGLKNGHKRAFVLQPLPLNNDSYLPIIAAPRDTATPTPTMTPDPTKIPTVTPTPIPSKAVDLTRYMIGDDRLYEVQHSSGSQSRHQTQLDEADEKRFFHTKGVEALPTDQMLAEWEELWASRSLIYRGTDTSPGNKQYYTLYEGNAVGSPWSPRYWKVGSIYERNPYVIFRNKSDCNIVASGFQRSWLRFEAAYDQYTFESDITLDNVIKLAWLLHPNGQPIEYYFYAEDFGLVGWGSNDRGYSYVNEIFNQGERKDNVREVIPCMSGLEQPLIISPELNFGPLPEPYASRVK